MHRRLIALFGTVLVLIAGCSSESKGYAEATETAFMAACTKVAAFGGTFQMTLDRAFLKFPV